MIKMIKEELHKLDNMEKHITATIKNAPKEKLRCVMNKGYYQYYIGDKYLGKNLS